METDKHTESTVLESSESTLSSPNDVGILPYVKVADSWTVDDETVMRYFAEIVAEGTHTQVFASGDIRSPEKFLAFMQDPSNIVTFLFKGNRIGGVAWLNGVVDNHAFGHFSTLKWAGGETVLAFGRRMFAHWFSIPDISGLPMLDVIIGLVAKRNMRALSFVQKLGCKRIGEIPNMLKDAYNGDRDSLVILYRERDG